VNYLELIAASLGFITTILYARQNIWSWPLGIIMVILYFIIFYQVRLYADMLSQIVFFILQLYGWWYWLYGGDTDTHTHTQT